jgi:hypothetical protein
MKWLLPFRVTAGYRFDPPKKVKELYDQGTKVIGLYKKEGDFYI